MKRSHLLTFITVFMALQCPSIAVAEEATTPVPEASSQRGKTCLFVGPTSATLAPGDYFRCEIDVKELLIAGTGDFNFGDSSIKAERIVFANEGTVNLSISDITADHIEFKSGAFLKLLGARVIAKKICGDLRPAEASGMTMIAEDQISLNLINVDLRGATIRTEIFGPGALNNAELFPNTRIDCRTNLADFSGANGRAEGSCPEPDQGDPNFQCD